MPTLMLIGGSGADTLQLSGADVNDSFSVQPNGPRLSVGRSAGSSTLVTWVLPNDWPILAQALAAQ